MRNEALVGYSENKKPYRLMGSILAVRAHQSRLTYRMMLSLGSVRGEVSPDLRATGPPVSSASRCDHNLALLYSHMLSPAQL